MTERAPQRLSVVIANWRDTRNPEGGGSERYVERVAAALVARGHQVTVLCAAHANAPPDEVRDAVRFRRRGGKLGVYPQVVGALLARRLGRVDVVVDVQNGLPFWTRLVTRTPVVVLVHHVHREQWPVVYGRVMARLGWWLESRLAPRVYRGCQYVAVSEVTKRELVGLGVRADDVAVVHNGSDPAPARVSPRDPQPRLVCLGRLVPHKQVEHALRVVQRLRGRWPGLRLAVVGDGWWAPALAAEAVRLGVLEHVELRGRVDEADKHAELDRAWVMLAPSLKEGWGLVVVEAGSHGVPTVGYRSAGGLAESVVQEVSGILVEDVEELARATARLLEDDELRERLGSGAAARAAEFSWETTGTAFVSVLEAAVRREPRRAGTDEVKGSAQLP